MELLILAVALLAATTDGSRLRYGFYDRTCPEAEILVFRTMSAAYAENKDIAADMLRLHFHDTFVQGCDGSVLLNSTLENKAEKDADVNFSLKGFDLIEKAKSAVEASCRGTVSCADILAFAARDAVGLAGKIHYSVRAGRLDGFVSRAQEAEVNMPSPLFSAGKLIKLFGSKGLTPEEMVTLSASHSIGDARCRSFVNRLYNFSGSAGGVDPSLSPALAKKLQKKCPFHAFSNSTDVNLDQVTPDRLDNIYYRNVRTGQVVLSSDSQLLRRKRLRDQVREYARNANLWAAKYAKAMVKMGEIGVKGENQGEIRKTCGAINNAY